jgi:hypothetical protein
MRQILRLVALAAILLAASPAAALPPQQDHFPFTVDFVDEEICGFPIAVSFEGAVTVMSFVDREGNLARIEMHSYDYAKATNLLNSKSATGHEMSNLRVDVEAGTEILRGLPIHFKVPGHGTVLMEVGRLVFDASGNPTFVAGQHQLLAGDFSELCAGLD